MNNNNNSYVHDVLPTPFIDSILTRCSHDCFTPVRQDLSKGEVRVLAKVKEIVLTLQEFHADHRKIFVSGGYAAFLSGRTTKYTDVDIYITADAGDVQPDTTSLEKWSCFGEDILKEKYMDLFTTTDRHQYNPEYDLLDGHSDFFIRHNTHSELDCGDGLILDVNLIDLYTFEQSYELKGAADIVVKAHDMAVCRVSLFLNSAGNMVVYSREQAGLSLDMAMSPEKLIRCLGRQNKYRERMLNFGAPLSLLKQSAKTLGLEY